MMSFSSHRVGGVVLAILFILFSIAAYAHPLDGYTAEVPENYDELIYHEEDSYGELKFIPLIDINSLSNEELACFIPIETEDFGSYAWLDNVMIEANRVFLLTGSFPSIMNEETFFSDRNEVSSSLKAVNRDYLDYLRSPLTGEYPKLDCEAFSPGNLFIKILTDEEKMHYAKDDDFLKYQWFFGQLWNENPEDPEVRLIKCSPVYYVRLYGYEDIIYTSLWWRISSIIPGELPRKAGMLYQY